MMCVMHRDTGAVAHRVISNGHLEDENRQHQAYAQRNIVNIRLLQMVGGEIDAPGGRITVHMV